MEAKFVDFLETVASFLYSDNLTCCDSDIVAGCEKKVVEAEKGDSAEFKNESIMHLSWALVHSERRKDDVRQGIAMLEANSTSQLNLMGKLYLLAVGYYRSGEYARSREIVIRCLELRPEFRQSLFLKRVIEDGIKKDRFVGIGFVLFTVGLISAGLLKR